MSALAARADIKPAHLLGGLAVAALAALLL